MQYIFERQATNAMLLRTTIGNQHATEPCVYHYDAGISRKEWIQGAYILSQLTVSRMLSSGSRLSDLRAACGGIGLR
jgi:hypothetical protein